MRNVIALYKGQQMVHIGTKSKIVSIIATLFLLSSANAQEYAVQIGTCGAESCISETLSLAHKNGVGTAVYSGSKSGYVIAVRMKYTNLLRAKKGLKIVQRFKKDAFVRKVDPAWSAYVPGIEKEPLTQEKSVVNHEPQSRSVTPTVQVTYVVDTPASSVVVPTATQQKSASEVEKVYRYDCVNNRGVTVEANRYKHVVIEYDCPKN